MAMLLLKREPKAAQAAGGKVAQPTGRKTPAPRWLGAANPGGPRT